MASSWTLSAMNACLLVWLTFAPPPLSPWWSCGPSCQLRQPCPPSPEQHGACLWQACSLLCRSHRSRQLLPGPSKEAPGSARRAPASRMRRIINQAVFCVTWSSRGSFMLDTNLSEEAQVEGHRPLAQGNLGTFQRGTGAEAEITPTGPAAGGHGLAALDDRRVLAAALAAAPLVLPPPRSTQTTPLPALQGRTCPLFQAGQFPFGKPCLGLLSRSFSAIVKREKEGFFQSVSSFIYNSPLKAIALLRAPRRATGVRRSSP